MVFAARFVIGSRSRRRRSALAVAEMALAHTIGNAVEAAYRRGDLFEKRQVLMSKWSSYCAHDRKRQSSPSAPNIELTVMVVVKKANSERRSGKSPRKTKRQSTSAGLELLATTGMRMTDPVKEKFLRCLEVCVLWYNHATMFNYGERQKSKRAYIRRLKTAAGEIELLIKSDAASDNFQSALKSMAPISTLLSLVQELGPKLTRIESMRSDSKPVTGLECEFIEELQYEDHFKERSPFDWLAGVYLPEVYLLFFSGSARLGEG